jgi:hypothetical protein
MSYRYSGISCHWRLCVVTGWNVIQIKWEESYIKIPPMVEMTH